MVVVLPPSLSGSSILFLGMSCLPEGSHCLLAALDLPAVAILPSACLQALLHRAAGPAGVWGLAGALYSPPAFSSAPQGHTRFYLVDTFAPNQLALPLQGLRDSPQQTLPRQGCLISMVFYRSRNLKTESSGLNTV